MKRNIYLSYIYNFIDRLKMQEAIWVLYLAFHGMSLTQIGLIEGTYHLTGIICEVPSGAIADLFGRKKTMLMGRICVLVSCLLMLYGHTFWVFCLAFMIQALGNNLNSGADEALLFDSMKTIGLEDYYMKSIGIVNVIISFSAGMATVIGAWLAQYSYFACYLTSCILCVLTLIPIALMQEPPIERQENKQTLLEMIKSHFVKCYEIVRDNKNILKLILMFNSMFVTSAVLYFYSQAYYDSFGITKIELSYIMLFVSLCSTFGSYVSDKVYQKIGKRVVFYTAISVLVCAISYYCYHMWISILLFGINQFLTSMLYPIASSLLNNEIPSQQRATLISLDSLCFSLGMIVLFPVIGFVTEHIF